MSRVRVKVTEQPAIEPVELVDVRTSIGINDATFDTYINALISSSRQFVEEYLNRKLIDQELTAYYDSARSSGLVFEGEITAPEQYISGETYLDLRYAPIASVTEISTFNDDNEESVFDASNYYLENFDDDATSSIRLNYGKTWPTGVRASMGYKVVYRAGYGTTKEDVPSIIRGAIKMMTVYMFQNRGDSESSDKGFMASGAEPILNTYRRFAL